MNEHGGGCASEVHFIYRLRETSMSQSVDAVGGRDTTRPYVQQKPGGQTGDSNHDVIVDRILDLVGELKDAVTEERAQNT